ncbi:MAG: dienelactone hydrolase family protein [Anaerolineae bacterium]|nr:dienelactone hydrolase family protein [Anaerolineae bacterium]
MEADRLEYPINSAFIRIVAAGNVLPAFWAHPDTGGMFPGLVVIHDQSGLTAFIRRLVRRLAQAGHYVIAPDLFNQQHVDATHTARQLAASMGETGPPYVAAAIGAVATHNHCNGDIALFGLGLGGTLALYLAAHRDDLKAAIAINGDPQPVMTLLPAASTPILALYDAGSGGVTAEARTAFQAALEAAPPDHALVTYPAAGRDFFDDTQPGHDRSAANDAWVRALDFLAARLAGPSQPPDIRMQRL